MNNILDILIKAPISKLADIDPKLVGLVLKANDERSGDIVFNGDRATYISMRDQGWTDLQLVRKGYARWA